MRDGRISTDYVTFSTRGWDVAAELAARQHGVVALRQLVEAGVAAATVRGWVRSRRLIRLHQGVFAAGHDSLRPEGRYLAAVLACGPGAALSYVSAAAFSGLRRSAASLIDVTAPNRAGRQKPGLRVHRGEHLAADETTVTDAVPVTTIARTLLDLAVVLSPRGVESAVEAAERLELFDLRAVTLLLSRHFGRRGTARLRRVLGDFDSEVVRARSESEARLFHLCLDHGLPRPRLNRHIEAGRERFEVDLCWPDARVIVEVDSPYHDTTAARARDAYRDAELRRAGWRVIRCRGPEIVDEPERLVFRIRRHLAAGGFR
jgi:very-short-patch-repair endonuclease